MLRKPLIPEKVKLYSECCTSYECLRGRKVPHYRYTVKTDGNGDLVQCSEVLAIDTSVPVTPQSGLSVRIGDLSFMLKQNVALKHDAAHLSLSDSRNPFLSAVVGRELSSRLEQTIDGMTKIKKSSKKE